LDSPHHPRIVAFSERIDFILASTDRMHSSYLVQLRPFRSLWFRIALPFLLFVALGSLVLVWWLQAAARRESEHVFTTLARTNADFIKSTRLPTNERVAEPLGRVLGMRMFFKRDTGALIPKADEELASDLRALAPDARIARVGFNSEAIGVPVESGLFLILVRPAEHRLAFLRRPATLTVLAAFWLLSLALAWSVTRGVVRPLRLLTSRLPHIEDDPESSLPGAERDDEIGQLARAYLGTRTQLAEERERRIDAERFALLGRMATGLAHEIHNPLSAIRLHAQMLSSAAPDEVIATNAESAPVLLSESARIEGLVNQWMFLARPAPPQLSPAELGSIVSDVLRTHAALMVHASVEVDVRVGPELQVAVDRRRLTQAIGNVAINAIQAMPDGGRLTILGEKNEAIRLKFRDTGAGFSPAALERHAELFFTEKEGGMGIGLSVSSEILKAHGGALEVLNSPEGGAVVTLILPVPSPIS
jgi:signal transduction histidine kinase